MGKALYRAYRSTSLDEIIGQEHITKALGRALETGQISHAYLFTGPRGVGKTSVARILAYAVNGLPYESEGQHLDIVEIDAASNNGVEDVRELREKVHIAPTSSKYKVYIIDEVHMLSKAAFNALLKTLEEPPQHVIFILATTELHKVPETIISRTQQFSFRTVSEDLVIDHLKQIAKQEKFKIDDDALRLIAQYGRGSFRDSISLLDQVRLIGGNVSSSDVEALLGRAPEQLITDILQTVADSDLPALVALLDRIRQNGTNYVQLASQLSERLRSMAVDPAGATLPASDVLTLLENLSELGAARDPRTLFEVHLLRVIRSNMAPQPVARPVAATPVIKAPEPVRPEPAATAVSQSIAPPQRKPEVVEPAKPAAANTNQPIITSEVTVGTGQISDQQWQEVLAIIRGSLNTLYGVLRMAQPTFGDGEATLTFRHEFHRKRASDAKNDATLRDALTKVCGGPIVVQYICGEGQASPSPVVATATASVEPLPDLPLEEPMPLPPETPVSEPAAQDSAELDSISNIFGAVEVLDS